MTHDELVERLEDILCTWEGDPCERYNCAISIMNTIFAALQEPTEGMVDATGSYYIEDKHRDLVVWNSMLAASPLASTAMREMDKATTP